MSVLPTLITPRLILRAHTCDEYDLLHAIWSDPVVTEFLGRRPSTAQDSWFRLMRYLGHWSLMGYGYFAVCDKITGAYIGDVGIAQHRRGLHVEFDDVPEAGWVLCSAAFGKGYATEAMAAVLTWFENTHGQQRTVCMIEKPHLASHKVAAKLGYTIFTQVVTGNDVINLLQRP